MPQRSRLRVATTIAVVAVTAAAIRASSTTFWLVATHADFLKGEAVEHVAIDGDGRLQLGPAQEVVHESTSPFLWSAVTDGAGGLVVGTGNEGQIFRVAADGKAAVLFDAAETQVQALAAGPDGAVYAATSPDGRVYRVARDGTATTIFDPEDKYLWALAVGADGALYVGSGDKGVVYRVGADGSSRALLETSVTHVTALAFDSAGRLLVGTESPGRLLRVEPDGRAFVLLEVADQEIHRIRVDARGRIFAVAVTGPKAADARSPEKTSPEPTATTTATPSVSTEITITAIGDVQVPASTATAPRSDARKDSKGTVYRVEPSGLWQAVWESSDDVPYDVAFEDADAFLVATGSKGKVLRVSGEPARTSLVARASAQQVTGFVRGPGASLLYVTSNPGKIYRLSTRPATRGVYESDVRDATAVATWGTIRWNAVTPAGSAVEISTRSGNTSRPDDTWSDWSPPYTRAAGAAIVSPTARYLQWRAVLTGAAGAQPVLTSVTAAYLPRNARPTIESITVHPPGIVFQRPFSTGEAELAGFESSTSDGRPLSPALPAAAAPPTLGRRTYQKGLQTLAWKAEDADQDRLQYDVWFRREGETAWRPLKRGLWDPILTWDTTSVPDGLYTVKVVASDAPGNAPVTALSGERESESFEVDNTPPTIEFAPGAEGARDRIRFVVRDAESTVQRVEYSLDASRWRVVYPADGMADAATEQYELELEAGGDAGAVIVRATDALNNVATATASRRR